MARFRVRFNQYKCNIKLNGEGKRDFKQEILTEHLFLLSHNGTNEDIKIQIIGYCDPNNQDARKDVSSEHFTSGHFTSKRFK